MNGDRTAPSLSVIVPVYNSEGTLPMLAERLFATLQPITRALEIIFVNDNSRDASWSVIRTLTKNNSRIVGINLMRNYGQHNALLAGIRAARFDIICTLDDDLQHPPEEVPKLLERLDENCDVVYGRPEKEQHGVLRDLASQVTKIAMSGAMGVEIARNVSAFRVFRTKVRQAFAEYRGSLISIDVLLTWGTTRFAAIPVRHDERRIGKSNYTPWRLLTHALNMITGFSILPLQLASILGFVFALFGLALLSFVLVRRLVSGSLVPGFTFLASAIAVFSGVHLVALGILGEYLARVHVRIMDRPAYVIRERVTSDVLSELDEEAHH